MSQNHSQRISCVSYKAIKVKQLRFQAVSVTLKGTRLKKGSSQYSSVAVGWGIAVSQGTRLYYYGSLIFTIIKRRRKEEEREERWRKTGRRERRARKLFTSEWTLGKCFQWDTNKELKLFAWKPFSTLSHTPIPTPTTEQADRQGRTAVLCHTAIWVCH